MPEFFLLDKFVHHQAWNFIKKTLQRKCFTVKFAKLLKVLCRTPPVSASDFNANFLTLRPRKTYIYVFPALVFFLIFLSHFMLLVEARNKSICFSLNFPLNKLYFRRLNVQIFRSAANWYSETTGIFFKDFKPKWPL